MKDFFKNRKNRRLQTTKAQDEKTKKKDKKRGRVLKSEKNHQLKKNDRAKTDERMQIDSYFKKNNKRTKMFSFF